MREGDFTKKFDTVRKSEGGEIMDSCFSFVQNALKEGRVPEDRELLKIFEEREMFNFPPDYPEERREEVIAGAVFGQYRDALIAEVKKYSEYKQGKITEDEINKITEANTELKEKLKKELLPQQ